MLNNNDWQSVGELMENYISCDDESRCFKTGIKQLDDVMKINDSSLTVIAGAKGTGRTTLAVQMALNMARQGNKVIYLSLKETKSQIAGIVVANDIGVPVNEIESRVKNGCILEVLGGVYGLPLYLSSSKEYSLEKILSMVKANRADIVFIDGFQDLAKSVESEEEIANMAIAIKELAMETEIPVVLTCELPVITKRYVPDLAYMGKYDELEYVSDSIILIGGEGATSSFYVSKNRDGKCDLLGVRFDRDKQQFVECSD